MSETNTIDIFIMHNSDGDYAVGIDVDSASTAFNDCGLSIDCVSTVQLEVTLDLPKIQTLQLRVPSEGLRNGATVVATEVLDEAQIPQLRHVKWTTMKEAAQQSTPEAARHVIACDLNAQSILLGEDDAIFRKWFRAEGNEFFWETNQTMHARATRLWSWLNEEQQHLAERVAILDPAPPPPPGHHLNDDDSPF